MHTITEIVNPTASAGHPQNLRLQVPVQYHSYVPSILLGVIE